VVDDEPLLRDALVVILSDLGYTVEAAADGREAVARFRDHHARCVAVLCDINLPLLTGPDVVRELRRIDPGVPVVMSSGFAREQTVTQLEGLAIDGYLAKPVRRSELAAMIASIARKLPAP
jgi:two-component system cell cycle sensor histidine kinase/response regulator CckA